MLEHISFHKNIMQYIGKIEDIISGKINNTMMLNNLDAKDYLTGFEIASPNDIKSLGESVLINQYCYTCSTNIDPDFYLKTQSYQNFNSPGFFLLPNNCKPNYLSKKSNINFKDFLIETYKHVNQPFAFTAIVNFKLLKILTIAKPPIYAENIFDNKDKYYPEFVKEEYNNITTFVMGAVSNMYDDNYLKINKGLQSVIYKNPFENNINKEIPDSHSHLLILSKHIKNISEITPDIVTKSAHTLETESQAESILSDIYLIDTLEPLN